MPDISTDTAKPEAKFPSEILYGEIKVTGANYDEDRLEDFTCLYEGGKKFHDNIHRFLVKRRIESCEGENAEAGKKHYADRCAKAWYIPRGAGLIDWLVAKVFEKEVKIVCNGGTEEQKAYWEGLNTNADGLGAPLSSIARQSLREVLTYGRGYFTTKFTDELGEAAKPETKDARLRSLPALLVNDWEFDAQGKLTMIRTHHTTMVRPNPWSQPDTKRQNWSFFTDTDIAEYSIDSKKDETPNDKAPVPKTDEFEHDFGEIPIFPVRASREMWVMERVYDCLVGLFNREVSVTWALDQMAYALLVLKLEPGNDMTKIVASEIAALRLNASAQEDAKFDSPSPKLHEPLFRDAERMKEALYEVIQLLAQNAIATQTQNARQSADAKELDMAPMATLLASFAWPIKDALTAWVEAMKRYRGEDALEITVQGIDEFDATLDDLKDAMTPDGGQMGDNTNDENENANAANGGPAQLRESKNIGLRDLSRKSGVSPGAISTIEAGGRNPGPQTIQKLASALGVDPGAYQAAVDAVYHK